jgi:peptidoglycan/xylan/chitin deacetylase (PgdA/CDA1 family)
MIGSHGWSHAMLTHCSEKELGIELRESRSVLEDKLGIRVSTMSLPGGRYNQRVLAACREAGYTKVYTSVPRMEVVATEFTVGRVNIDSNMTVDYIARLLQPRSGELSRLQGRYRKKEATKKVLGDWLYEKLWNAVNRKEQDLSSESSASDEYSADYK